MRAGRAPPCSAGPPRHLQPAWPESRRPQRGPSLRPSRGTVTVAQHELDRLRRNGPPPPQQPASPAAPPAAAPSAAALPVDSASQDLSASEREEVTQAVIQAFLSVEQHLREGEGGAGSGGAHLRAGRTTGGGEQPCKPRGLQGKVVAHLMEGSFDEEFLAGVPTHTLNWAVLVLGQQGQPGLAEQLFHWMRITHRANEHSFVQLCGALEACRQPSRALQGWRNVRRMARGQLLGPRAAAALLKTFRPTGDLQGALSTLRELERQRAALNQYAYNIVLRLAADLGSVDVALGLLAQLRGVPGSWGAGSGGPDTSAAAFPPGGGDLRPDHRSYSAALDALSQGGALAHTALMHGWMQEDGLEPDDTLFAQLLSCYGSLGNHRRAQAVFDELLASGSRPNRTHWNALLYALGEGAQLKPCQAAYERMLQAGSLPDSRTLVAVLRAAFHTQQGLRAVSWAQREMWRHHVPLRLELATAMICCCRHPPSGNARAARRAVQTAEAIFRELQRAGHEAPNVMTYNSLMLVHRGACDWRGVLLAFRALEASDVLPNAVTFGIMVDVCRVAGWADLEAQFQQFADTMHLLGLDVSDSSGSSSRDGAG